MWIRKVGAFEPIVSPEIFEAAQQIIRSRHLRYTEEEMIKRLGLLYERHGYLSTQLIDNTDGMPHSSRYSDRFGSLIHAYRMVGFKPSRTYRHFEIKKLMERLQKEIFQLLEERIVRLGGCVRHDTAANLIWINEELSISVLPVRCMSYPSGVLFWKLRFSPVCKPDILVVVRLDEKNQNVLDYCLLPSWDNDRSCWVISEANTASIEGYRLDTLDYLFHMAERISPWSSE